MMTKGQVSLEYLMTYGIAIAIVVIAVAALYSMGVFSPSSSTVACSPCFANYAFVDYASTTGELVLKNGAREINVTSCTGATCSTGTVNPNTQFTITVTDTSSASTTVVINYDDALSGLAHSDTATIHN